MPARRLVRVDPLLAGQLGSLGYGSLGTGSLLDLLTGAINTGSVVLSVDVPNSTGSYAPGSLGSYGPEASVAELPRSAHQLSQGQPAVETVFLTETP